MRERRLAGGVIGDRNGPLFVPSRKRWDGYILPSKADQRWMAQIGIHEMSKFKLVYPVNDNGSQYSHKMNDDRTREEKEQARLPKLDPRDKDRVYAHNQMDT